MAIEMGIAQQDLSHAINANDLSKMATESQ